MKIYSSGPAIPAQDIKRAREFYEQKLGLTASDPGPDGSVTYRTGETRFIVFPSSGKASGTHTQMGLEVDDVKGAVAELKAKGVQFEDYDFDNFKTEGSVLSMPDGGKVAWFKDSEGNLVSINSGLPSATRN
ncbi:MAG TPA: VOC family protein [Candidatus Dormibacteraeota bacterium]|jgi:predicted enzyme related to lactoylglutathione lyase